MRPIKPINATLTTPIASQASNNNNNQNTNKNSIESNSTNQNQSNDQSEHSVPISRQSTVTSSNGRDHAPSTVIHSTNNSIIDDKNSQTNLEISTITSSTTPENRQSARVSDSGTAAASVRSDVSSTPRKRDEGDSSEHDRQNQITQSPLKNNENTNQNPINTKSNANSENNQPNPSVLFQLLGLNHPSEISNLDSKDGLIQTLIQSLLLQLQKGPSANDNKVPNNNFISNTMNNYQTNVSRYSAITSQNANLNFNNSNNHQRNLELPVNSHPSNSQNLINQRSQPSKVQPNVNLNTQIYQLLETCLNLKNQENSNNHSAYLFSQAQLIVQAKNLINFLSAENPKISDNSNFSDNNKINNSNNQDYNKIGNNNNNFMGDSTNDNDQNYSVSKSNQNFTNNNNNNQQNTENHNNNDQNFNQRDSDFQNLNQNHVNSELFMDNQNYWFGL